MMKSFRRISALMLALVMLSGVFGALAEQPAHPTALDAYNRGKSVKATARLEVDVETLSGMLGMFMMSDGEDQEAQAQLLGTVMGVFNKLRVDTISSKSGASFVLGTQQGPLLELQALMSEGLSGVTSNLFPGIMLSVDPEMMKSFSSLQSQMNLPQVSAQMMAPYGQALGAFAQANILAPVEPEAVEKAVDGLGSFSSKLSFSITRGTMAGAIESLRAVFAEDMETQKTLDEYLKNLEGAVNVGESAIQEAGVEAPEKSIRSSADLLAALDEGIAEMNENPDVKLANVAYFISQDGKTRFAEFEVLSESGRPEALLSLGAAPAETGRSIRGSLITNALPYGVEESPEAAALPVDWDALRAAAQSGENSAAMLVEFAANSKADSAALNLDSDFSLNLLAEGLPVSVTGNTRNALSGAFRSEGRVNIAFMSPTPLLSIVFDSTEVDEQPAALAPSDRTILLKEDMSEEDQQLMTQTLQQSVPQLMERLQTALPEEAPLLLTMLMAAPEGPIVSESTNP